MVNGACETLKFQVIDSAGGLYYHNYREFEKAIKWLVTHKNEREILARKGLIYVNKNYGWDIIEKKFKISIDIILNQLKPLF